MSEPPEWHIVYIRLDQQSVSGLVAFCYLPFCSESSIQTRRAWARSSYFFCDFMLERCLRPARKVFTFSQGQLPASKAKGSFTRHSVRMFTTPQLALDETDDVLFKHDSTRWMSVDCNFNTPDINLYPADARSAIVTMSPYGKPKDT